MHSEAGVLALGALHFLYSSRHVGSAYFTCHPGFAIRQKYQAREKQVTVITTSNSAIQQPSMGRLAHLVAREMGKYLVRSQYDILTLNCVA